MTPSAAAGTKSGALDFKKSLVETFAINEKANQLLLSHVADAAWQAPSPSGNGRSIGAIAAHIHHVRLMWLSAADKNLYEMKSREHRGVRQMRIVAGHYST